jgi:hypothetical protein
MKIIKFKILILITLFNSSCGVLIKQVIDGTNSVNNSQIFRQGQHGELTEEELEWGKIAWKYFENNYNPQTGLVNSTNDLNSINMWLVGDYISALISAHKLKIINDYTFNHRITSLLGFLNSMKLFNNKLPNTFYDTKTGKLINKENNFIEEGWSAVDIGRLLICLKILKTFYPETSEYVDKAVLRWNICDMISSCGVIYSNRKDKLYEEIKIGYHSYIYKGFQLWGFNTENYINSLKKENIKIYNELISYDPKNIKVSDNFSFITTEPFILNGLEFNWDKLDDNNSMDSIHTDQNSYNEAYKIYLIQEKRYRIENIFTSRGTFYSKNKKSWLYNTIFGEGYLWNTFNQNGKNEIDSSIVSTKSSFGLWSLWQTDYTKKLINLLKYSFDSKNGWFEGKYENNNIYESSNTLSTNSLILESLFYKVNGRIFYNNTQETYYNIILKDEFKRPPNACFIRDKGDCN